MIIDRKFNEAKYFLKQVEKLEHSPEEMIYNLNAFLTSSKSITDYYGKELGKASDKWYKNANIRYPLIEYFRIKRNVVVHHRFLDIVSKTEIMHTEYITVAPAELTVELIRVDKEGNRIEEDSLSGDNGLVTPDADKCEDSMKTRDSSNHSENQLSEEESSICAVANSYYYFEDYPDKTVLELCKQYLMELQMATGYLETGD